MDSGCGQRHCSELSNLCSSGTRRGVVGFKGCSPAPSYPPRVSYLVSPPGLSIASYSRVCRTYLCNNLTSLDPFMKLKNTPKPRAFSSLSCPTCVGEHSKDCLPNFVTTDSCPDTASKCYSSTLKFQAGERRDTLSNAYSMPGAVWYLPIAEGGWWDLERGLGLQAPGTRVPRWRVPGAQVFGGRAGVLVCEGCLEGGMGQLNLESVPDSSLSSLQGFSIPPSSSWAVLVNNTRF